MERVLCTDETVDAVVSLEMVAEQLPKVMHNAHYWKWVIIALHAALQGFMVLALKGSDSLDVLTEKAKKAWLDRVRGGQTVFPKRELLSFMKLYEKIQSGRALYEKRQAGQFTYRTEEDMMMKYDGSIAFQPSGTQTESVEMLNELRNKFVHFVPAIRSLEVRRLPQAVGDCVNIVSFLAFDCQNVLWHDRALESRTRELVERINQQIALVKKSYDLDP